MDDIEGSAKILFHPKSWKENLRHLALHFLALLNIILDCITESDVL